MKSGRLAAGFACLALASVLLVSPIHRQRQVFQMEELDRLGRMPPALLRTIVLEYKGVAADVLLIRTISYIGHNLLAKKKLSPEEWRTVAQLLHRITDLDPRFWDPYLLAEMMLPWDAGMAEEADILLKKAARARPEDFRPLYFLGFNAFFFAKDASKAAPYLRRAANLPGAPPYLQGLAARFSLYAGETEPGILFLKNLLAASHDESITAYLKKRLQAMETLLILERAVQKYRQEQGRLPADVDELLRQGYLDESPVDPYGGDFRILANGRVYTTSNLVPPKRTKEK